MICPICERSCYISEDGVGSCGMYRNSGNVVEELYPNHYLLVCPISVETMPVLHFHPAAKFLQIRYCGVQFRLPGMHIHCDREGARCFPQGGQDNFSG